MSENNIIPKGFVYLNQICPTIKQDLKYASTDNFTNSIVRGMAKIQPYSLTKLRKHYTKCRKN